MHRNKQRASTTKTKTPTTRPTTKTHTHKRTVGNVQSRRKFSAAPVTTTTEEKNNNTDPLSAFASPNYNTIPTTHPILRTSLIHTANLLADGEIDPATIVQAANDQIIATTDTNTFLQTFPREPLNQAHWRVNKSPIAGIPIAIKDNIHYTGGHAGGGITTAGSQFLKGMVSPYNATITQRLLDAGAHIVGKTNLDEFGMGSYGVNSSYGATKSTFGFDQNGQHSPNRNNLQYFIPGGSSSGSAVALQQYTAYASIGTDTGGSVRLPAAFTGTVGFKPTYGALSRYGLIAYGSSFDCPGVMARTVADVKAVVEIIAGPDDNDSTCIFDIRQTESHFPHLAKLIPHIKKQKKIDGEESSPSQEINLQPFKGMKVGIPQELMFSDLSQDIKALWSTTANLFTTLGAEVYTVSIPSLEHCLPMYYVLAQSEAVSNLARYDGLRYGATHYNNQKDYEIAFYKKIEENGAILDGLALPTPNQLNNKTEHLKAEQHMLGGMLRHTAFQEPISDEKAFDKRSLEITEELAQIEQQRGEGYQQTQSDQLNARTTRVEEPIDPKQQTTTATAVDDGNQGGKKAIPNITPLQKLYSTNRELFFGPEVKQRLMVGNYVLSSSHYSSYIEKAMALRQELVLEFVDTVYTPQLTQTERHSQPQQAQSKVDIILCPTSTTLPPTINSFFQKKAKKVSDKDAQGDGEDDDMSAYIDDVMTVFANLIGAPALSLPAGTVKPTANGLEHPPLPVGMQIIGAPGSDMQLLDIGAVLQQNVKF